MIDVVRDHQLIEIQTRNFSAIRHKLNALLEAGHKVHLIHPVTVEKWIATTGADRQTVISRRKSPFRGSLTDLFEELVRLPELLLHPDFTLEVALIQEEEVRCQDGKGSRRRKHISFTDRRLLSVTSQVFFNCKEDFACFLPPLLPERFSSTCLAKALKIPVFQAQKITYCLRKMEVIKQTGKAGNNLVYERQGQESNLRLPEQENQIVP